MVKKTRLLVLANPIGATQHISFVQPLRAVDCPMQLDYPTPQESRGDYAARRVFWETRKPDVLVLSRYYDKMALDYLSLARKDRVPVIFHLDDDLLDVPMSLGAEKYARFHQPERIESLRRALEESSLVYASTPALGERLRAHGIRNEIFSGQIYCSVDLSALVGPGPSLDPVIGYMGTGGHSQDLAEIVPALERLMETFSTLRFETFGTIDPPPALQRFGARCQHHEGITDYDEFVRQLADLGWWIGLAPLEDNAFNRCKADTKWVEYSAAGIAVVAADLPVYGRAVAAGAAVPAREPEQWYAAVSALLRNGQRRAALVASARRLVLTDYTHARLLSQVVAVVDRACACDQPALRVAPSPSPAPKASPARILFVANALIPTLQLSFLKPLAPDFDAQRAAWRLISGEDIKAKLLELEGKAGIGTQVRAWLTEQIEEFDPTHVVFCRYSDRFADHIVQQVRKRGVPVLYHVDDDLLNVPREIGEAKFRLHNAPERLAAVRQLLEEADLIYCSTNALRQRYRDLGFGGTMEAGRIYCASGVLQPATLRPVRKIGYMGFDHAHDFELAVPAIVHMLRRYPELTFELFGSIPRPAELDEFDDRVVVIPPVRVYTEFLAKFASLGWDIGLCPLAPTGFNRVKANTKWVEYTSIGAAVIATRGMVYDECAADGCGVLVDGPDEWIDALERVCASPDLRFDLVRRAQARLTAEYSDEKLRQQVWDMLSRAESEVRPRSVEAT